MSIQCVKCGREVGKGQCYEHQGKPFCEDCYMDTLSPPQACDPWAVHSAKTFLKGKDKLTTLTPLQGKIVDCIKRKGEATVEEMMENLNLTEEVLRREFAVLRHMEILRGVKRGEKILFTLFRVSDEV